MDAGQLVAQVKSQGFFPLGVGVFDSLQIMSLRVSTGTQASGKGQGASPSKYRGRWERTS